MSVMVIMTNDWFSPNNGTSGTRNLYFLCDEKMNPTILYILYLYENELLSRCVMQDSIKNVKIYQCMVAQLSHNT